MSLKTLPADLSIKEKSGRIWEFKSMDLSNNGVTDLKIQDSTKFLNYGTLVSVGLKLHLNQKSYNFEGAIIRQFCKDGLLTGVRFFDPQDEVLTKLIEESGALPQWARKSPRIPTIGELKYMPNFALVYNQPKNITFFVGDLGMGGCMIYTEDPHALSLQYNETYEVELLPRADFESIVFKGSVTRAEHDFNTKHQIGLYRIGLRFQNFDDKNKGLFTKKIKKVVEELQSAQQ